MPHSNQRVCALLVGHCAFHKRTPAYDTNMIKVLWMKLESTDCRLRVSLQVSLQVSWCVQACNRCDFGANRRRAGTALAAPKEGLCNYQAYSSSIVWHCRGSGSVSCEQLLEASELGHSACAIHCNARAASLASVKLLTSIRRRAHAPAQRGLTGWRATPGTARRHRRSALAPARVRQHELTQELARRGRRSG